MPVLPPRAPKGLTGCALTFPLVTHHGDAEARRAGRVYLGILVGTSIGLLLWGAHHLGEEPIGYGAANGVNPLSRVGDWIRNLFPG